MIVGVRGIGVAIGIAVFVGVEIGAGAQENRTIAIRTVSNVLDFIFFSCLS